MVGGGNLGLQNPIADLRVPYSDVERTCKVEGGVVCISNLCEDNTESVCGFSAMPLVIVKCYQTPCHVSITYLALSRENSRIRILYSMLDYQHFR